MGAAMPVVAQQADAGQADAWTSPASTAVDRASDIIRRTRGFWTGLGYNTLRLTYSVGWFAAPAYEYVLLGAPTLAVKVETGGLASGLAWAVQQVSKDAALTIFAGLVGAPAPLARRVATETRRYALEEYRAAFNVANPYLDTGTLSEADAGRFLAARWGLFRLAAAGQLLSATMNNKSPTERLVTAGTKNAIEALVDRYQIRLLGLDKPLPIAKLGFLIKQANQILVAAGEGLPVYEPYQEFLRAMDAIDQAEARERQAEPLAGGSTQTGSVAPGTFRLTPTKHVETEDLDEAVRRELGAGYRVATWLDVSGQVDAALASMADQTAALLNGPTGPFWSGTRRHFYVQRSDGKLPYAGFLAHAAAGSRFWLGSWYGISMPVLAVAR